MPLLRKVIFYLILLIIFPLIFTCKEEQAPVKKEGLSFFEEATIAGIFLDDKIQQFQELLESSHHQNNFNGHILVAREGQVIFDNFIGYADPNKGDTLSEKAVYQLASVSKQFTAMAVMILKERGKLDYEDIMIDYIPELAGDKYPYYGKITIRHLLNHTAGLPNYMYYVEHYLGKDKRPYNDEVVQLMAGHRRYLNFFPGRRFDYSNTGYMILALIVERVSGQRFADFVDENIFQPLDMMDSYVYSRTYDEDRYPDKLRGFRKAYRYYTIPETQHDGVVGDKGVYSTARDLFKWDQGLYQETLVTQATLRDAFTPGKLSNGNDIPYGFGFRIRKGSEDRAVVYHHGLWNGFRTTLIRHIDEKNTVIVLDHANCRAKNRITTKAEDILLSSDLDYTKLLVERALNDGVDSAIDVYMTINNLGLDMSVSLESLDKIHHYLDQINKKQMANRIHELRSILSKGMNS